jgi:hypothetical protein
VHQGVRAHYINKVFKQGKGTRGAYLLLAGTKGKGRTSPKGAP